MECEDGEILSYDITRSDLRAKHVLEGEPGTCSDRLTITRLVNGSIVTCGRNTSLEWERRSEAADSRGDENRKLDVKFHSSLHCHNCGSFMFVSCVNRASTYNRPGCIDTSDIEKRDTTSSVAVSFISTVQWFLI